MLLIFVGAASAQDTSSPAKADGATPAHTLTGNLAVVSDYRFRGISQTYGRPAIQGGFDYTHSNGFYLGNWNSSVSSNAYNNGAGMEIDLYGGYRFPVTEAMTADVGVLRYIYPGALLNSAPATPTNRKYDTTEIYAALTRGLFNAKLSYAASDYFGLNGSTAGYAFFNALPNRGGSSGSTYLDLNYNVELGSKVTLGLHAGHTSVHRYSELSYSDYKVSLGKEFVGFNLAVAVVGSSANTNFYQITNPAGLNPRSVGKAVVVLSASKSF